MTPKQTKEARQKLGLTTTQMARMLGYKGNNTRVMMNDIESGKKPLREPQMRLMDAYMSGYRPKDWPLNPNDKTGD